MDCWHKLSTPSLGITRSADTLERRDLVFQLPLSGSLTYYALIKPVRCRAVIFQLPLSGSLANSSNYARVTSRTFQLPLSGSRRGSRRICVCDNIFTLSTPSLGITCCSFSSTEFNPFEKLSTPSLGITADHDTLLSDLLAFNSLSRDHLSEGRLRVGLVDRAFNSLSRDHERANEAIRGAFELSTPSLGITFAFCVLVIM